MKDKKKYTPFYETFLRLCEQAGLSATAAAKAAGISSGAPTAWKNKGSVPKPEQRQKLCALFGVTDDELLGYAKKEKPALPEEDELKLKVAAYWGGGEDLSKEELDELWKDAGSYFRFKMREKQGPKNSGG